MKPELIDLAKYILKVEDETGWQMSFLCITFEEAYYVATNVPIHDSEVEELYPEWYKFIVETGNKLNTYPCTYGHDAWNTETYKMKRPYLVKFIKSLEK
jgi:hypothetical protein